MYVVTVCSLSLDLSVTSILSHTHQEMMPSCARRFALQRTPCWSLESAFVDEDTLATRIVDAGLLGRAEAKEFVARLAELDVLKCLPSESRIQSPFFAESKAIVAKKKWFCLGTNSIFPL